MSLHWRDAYLVGLPLAFPASLVYLVTGDGVLAGATVAVGVTLLALFLLSVSLRYRWRTLGSLR